MTIIPLFLLLQLQWQVFFSPRGGTQDAIIRSIDSAKTQILVQAFDFTSDPITSALKRANNRKVEIKILMEDSKRKANKSKYNVFKVNSIDIKLDRENKLAHSKIIIIDSTRVITGSFNFSEAAEKWNAENTLVIDDTILAKHYIKNWYQRFNGDLQIKPKAIKTKKIRK